MPINHETKVLFVHIPKTAGTTIEKLMDMSHEENFYTVGKCKSPIFSSLDFSKFTEGERAEVEVKNLQHCTYRELKKLLPEEVFGPKYIRFSIVRNPYTRIVSEYFYLNRRSSQGAPDLVGFAEKFPTIESFVLSELSLPRFERIYKYDGHLEPQCDYLLDTSYENILALNTPIKIYHYERTLEDCIQWVQAKSGVASHNLHARNGNYNKNTNHHTPETLQVINEFYKKDFEIFGYPISGIS